MKHITNYCLSTSRIAVSRCFLLLLFTALLALAHAFENTAKAQSSDDKPSFVEQLKKTIDNDGAEAATQWFQSSWPATKDDYFVDSQALMMLMSEYLAAGDTGAAQVVGEITGTVMQDVMHDAMITHAPGMAEEMELMRKAEAEQQLRDQMIEQDSQNQVEQQSRGESRDDLGRFFGMYGDAGERQIFVTQSCDGFLVAGPMWADTPAWWMRSAADQVFTYSDSFFSLAFDFELNDKGQAIALNHDLEGVPDPLQRTGDLSLEFSECVVRPTR